MLRLDGASDESIVKDPSTLTLTIEDNDPVLEIAPSPVGGETFKKFINLSSGPMDIVFDSSKHQSVKINIFDRKGRHIRTVFDGVAAKGTNTPTWDSKDESGNPVKPDWYMAVLEIGGKTTTKKVIIAR